MISYLQAARELDTRWADSLQFLPPTPVLRNGHDCDIARQIATTELELFNRYAEEIANNNGLNLDVLIDLYNMLLVTGRLFAPEDEAVRIDGREPLKPTPETPPSASKPRRSRLLAHRAHDHRE